MTLFFLSIAENFDSPLVKSQFYQPFNCLDEHDKGKFISIGNFRNKPKINSTNVILPLLPRASYLYFKHCFLTKIFQALLVFIAKCLIPKNAKLVCRGYFAGLVGAVLKKEGHLQKLIWDPRSLFISENAFYKFFSNQAIIDFWSDREAFIAEQSDRILVVSQGMATHYLKICGVSKTRFVTFSGICRSAPLETSFEFVYYGSLNSGWNNLDVYTRIFKTFHETQRLLILSQDYKNVKSKGLRGCFCNVSSNSKASSLLAQASYGLFVFPDTSDAHTRFSVKVATYLSNGVTPIVSKNLTGLIDFLSENELPYLVYEHVDLPSLKSKSIKEREHITQRAWLAFKKYDYINALY